MKAERLTDEVHEKVRSRVGDEVVTGKSEQQYHKTKKLEEFVDPKEGGVIRRSIGYRQEEDAGFRLVNGTAMLLESRFDTTYSMGNNVDIVFGALPRIYNLLRWVDSAPLGRYDLQIINGNFNDVSEDPIICRSMAEMGEQISEQLTYLVPVRRGGDTPEDPQYGIFGAAYLTDCDIHNYGLKHYDFTITDAPGRDRILQGALVKIFGPHVFDKVKENGRGQFDENNIPSTREVVKDLLKTAHAFVLVVGSGSSTINFWTEIYGDQRVVILPETRFLPEVKAAIVGLTEGVFTLSTIEEFLVSVAGMSKEDAKRVKRAVAHIPIGEQTKFENFAKIPLRDDVFSSKDRNDLWPIK